MNHDEFSWRNDSISLLLCFNSTKATADNQINEQLLQQYIFLQARQLNILTYTSSYVDRDTYKSFKIHITSAVV